MQAATQTVPRAHKEIKLSPADEVRFWSKVDKSGGEDACWLWTAGADKYGYGSIRLGKLVVRSYRVAYTLTHGEIPHDGSYHGGCVCHKCDNPPCCNPAHLFLGTHRANIADRTKKGREAKGDNHSSRTHPERLARGDRSGSRLHPESRPRGEGHAFCKLKASQVIEIRARFAAGGITQKDLASEFAMSAPYISNIISRRKWKHI